MDSNNNQTQASNNEHDTDIVMSQDITHIPSNMANTTPNQDVPDSINDATMTEGAVAEAAAWQPTAEELAAAAEFDEANTDDQTDQPLFTPEQILQQLLDHEMALQFNALENGQGHVIGLPWDDVGVPPETFECSCGDTFTHVQLAQAQEDGQVVMLTCSHIRCKDCLNQNVRVGLSSRANFPPKCCGPFDIVDIVDHLDEDVRATWFEKQEEYNDLAPVYCAVKECSQYLNKDQLVEGRRWALCDKCNVKTCTGCLCLQSAHKEGSAECPERIDKMDKDLMVKQGWKPCPRCANMIERSEGCDHMTCDCGQEFCYSCGRLIDGAIPCNCNGQREWAEEDAEVNDVQAQQQIMDAIRRDQGDLREEDDDFDEDDIDEDNEGEISADEEEVMEEDDEESDGQQNEVDGHDDDDARRANDQAQVDTQESAQLDPHSLRARTLINAAIRLLHDTEPELAARMDLLSRVQSRPYSLPGFAADVRRVREMSGEAFNNEMHRLEDSVTATQSQPDIAV